MLTFITTLRFPRTTAGVAIPTTWLRDPKLVPDHPEALGLLVMLATLLDGNGRCTADEIAEHRETSFYRHLWRLMTCGYLTPVEVGDGHGIWELVHPKRLDG